MKGLVTAGTSSSELGMPSSEPGVVSEPGAGVGAGGGSISTGGLALRRLMRRVAVSAKLLSGYSSRAC